MSNSIVTFYNILNHFPSTDHSNLILYYFYLISDVVWFSGSYSYCYLHHENIGFNRNGFKFFLEDEYKEFVTCHLPITKHHDGMNTPPQCESCVSRCFVARITSGCDPKESSNKRDRAISILTVVFYLLYCMKKIISVSY